MNTFCTISISFSAGVAFAVAVIILMLKHEMDDFNDRYPNNENE